MFVFRRRTNTIMDVLVEIREKVFSIPGIFSFVGSLLSAGTALLVQSSFGSHFTAFSMDSFSGLHVRHEFVRQVVVSPWELGGG